MRKLRAAWAGGDNLVVAPLVKGHSTLFTRQALGIIMVPRMLLQWIKPVFRIPRWNLGPLHSRQTGWRPGERGIFAFEYFLPTFATNLCPNTGNTFSMFLSCRSGIVLSSRGIWGSSGCSAAPAGRRTSVPDGVIACLSSSFLHV